MTATRQTLENALRDDPDLAFAVLVGSRATGSEHGHSDWDIALQWSADLAWMSVLAKTETLRRKLALAAGLPESAIDLIDLRRANLTMRASVAEEGQVLAGAESLEWARFLRRTWRDLEDFYWEQRDAA